MTTMLTVLQTVNDWVNWTAESYGAPSFFVGAFVLLFYHFGPPMRDRTYRVVEIGFPACAGLILWTLVFAPQGMSLARLISVIFLYGVGLFVALSAYLKRTLAQRLTKWRGEAPGIDPTDAE